MHMVFNPSCPASSNKAPLATQPELTEYEVWSSRLRIHLEQRRSLFFLDDRPGTRTTERVWSVHSGMHSDCPVYWDSFEKERMDQLNPSISICRVRVRLSLKLMNPIEGWRLGLFNPKKKRQFFLKIKKASNAVNPRWILCEGWKRSVSQEE